MLLHQNSNILRAEDALFDRTAPMEKFVAEVLHGMLQKFPEYNEITLMGFQVTRPT
jgi:hypothetical protein